MSASFKDSSREDPIIKYSSMSRIIFGYSLTHSSRIWKFGTVDWFAVPKNLWMVCPAILWAAMPVGANLKTYITILVNNTVIESR